MCVRDMSRREAEISELQAALQEETNKTFQLSGELDATKTSMRLEISALLRKVRAILIRVRADAFIAQMARMSRETSSCRKWSPDLPRVAS